ncbi:hypothetical protein WJX84_006678 [Apatococcus fuscideae]|uniref:Glutathione S-transferase n=1 Tax=Apatococcus fuscideae TaxID=2026836 RepID=A0AAW1T7C5_9CHLO
MSSSSTYTLYTAGTPNGWKVSILMEELGLDYKLQPVNIFKGEQKEDWFMKINPNARIPALVDHEAGNVRVFESGAIMWYLAVKHGKFFPKEAREQAETMSWLMFQMGGLGPMQGQASHFLRFAPEKGKDWIANDDYSIADMATFPWVLSSAVAGLSLEGKPNLQKWIERCLARPATSRGLDVPEPNKAKGLKNDPAAADKMFAEMNVSIK